MGCTRDLTVTSRGAGGRRPGVSIMDVGEHYGGAAKLSQKTGLLWVRETFQEWQQDTAVLISNYPHT